MLVHLISVHYHTLPVSPVLTNTIGVKQPILVQDIVRVHVTPLIVHLSPVRYPLRSTVHVHHVLVIVTTGTLQDNTVQGIYQLVVLLIFKSLLSAQFQIINLAQPALEIMPTGVIQPKLALLLQVHHVKSNTQEMLINVFRKH